MLRLFVIAIFVLCAWTSIGQKVTTEEAKNFVGTFIEALQNTRWQEKSERF